MIIILFQTLGVSGLGLHQRQPSYLPDYNGIFSLQALNFTPAAIDKTEKFLQILHQDNPLAPNISNLASFFTTTTQEGRQYQSTDHTTDRLNPEQTDYFNEVDSGNINLHLDSGNTKLDSGDSKTESDFSDSRLNLDSGTPDYSDSNSDLDSSNVNSDSANSNLDLNSSDSKLESNSDNAKLDSGSSNSELDTDSIATHSSSASTIKTEFDYGDSKIDVEFDNLEDPKVSGDTSKTKIHSDNNNLGANTQDPLTAFPHNQFETKTINNDSSQPSEITKTPESEKVATTQSEDLFSTILPDHRTSEVVKSNNSDVLLSDSGNVEKQPDIFDHLMTTIQSHWSEFVGKMKLSVLDVWKTISQQMMVRLENFATAL